MLFIDSSLSRRSKDENGFLIIKDNPIGKAGVFDYLLSEIESDVKDLKRFNNVGNGFNASSYVPRRSDRFKDDYDRD